MLVSRSLISLRPKPLGSGFVGGTNGVPARRRFSRHRRPRSPRARGTRRSRGLTARALSPHDSPGCHESRLGGCLGRDPGEARSSGRARVGIVVGDAEPRASRRRARRHRVLRRVLSRRRRRETRRRRRQGRPRSVRGPPRHRRGPRVRPLASPRRGDVRAKRPSQGVGPRASPRDGDGGGDAAAPRVPLESRPFVRRAALAALIAAPAETRRLLAECLRLASILDRGDASPGGADPASAARAPSSSFVPPLETHGAALVDDVLAALESRPGPVRPARSEPAPRRARRGAPFQYFRDPRRRPTRRRALERLCASFATPVLLPALQRAARGRPATRAPRARRGWGSRFSTASSARTRRSARPPRPSPPPSPPRARLRRAAGNAADPESWVAASAR